jgi:hypothetical protein
MLILSIPRMSCGGCSSTVEETVRALDSHAQIGFNMKGRTASVMTSAEPARYWRRLRGWGIRLRCFRVLGRRTESCFPSSAGSTGV